MVAKQFEVYLIDLGATVGSEMRKFRPCVVVSPDEMNRHIATVIVAPLTTKRRKYPSRVDCHFDGKLGQVVLDQIRTLDKSRLTKCLGAVPVTTQKSIKQVLVQMFG